MPGYGIAGPDEGTGLLPWSWAEERLVSSRNYWVATVWPDGRPHAMPVWGVWEDDVFWFSSGLRARKIRNLMANPRCVVTTENPDEPVVLEGTAEIVTEHEKLAEFIARTNAKYDTDYSVDFLDPKVNATVGVRPSWVFALTESDFGGSPTRWTFEG
ncbi:MAG: pyridoxamine 5'-phosphate oxidase [Streptosporangiales bacterium]|nr:pyridoxamine 5'-phosphate oxidase [Streptosporangiales bacterium]